ncbi:hypothetical protein BDN67DRAFT_230149 [Paxillus ammoniavirescens]|nr:hypothetical protein BDN67DRAFT_230149 [Paxillus ammoniavirescens]
MDVDDSTPTMPPRMRKPWVQSPASQSEDHSPREHRQGAEIWGWRSPPETNAESPVSVSGADVEGNVGQNQGVTARSASVNGNGHDGADGQDAEFDTDTDTGADGVDDTRQMPPPPMPASLDPTTVSSLAHACGRRSASPRLPVQWEKSGSPRVSTTWIPPQAPTPTSATTARTSQSPNQTHHPATPALSYASVPASSPPPLVHQHDTLSSASLPSPTQAEAQSHSSPLTQTQLAQTQLLPPTVSPSAPFSQLSLHSPNATSLSPHQSVLFGSGEGTFLSPASAPAPESIYSIPRKQVSPPPPHKPSKPLHVHPQNEAPSVPAPVSVPIVRIESPDATRDTPTQAQHKHKHRSSPESSHHTLGSPDGEKARTAEAHRVRFASPEVLSGLPGLIGKAGMGDIKDADVSVEDDVVQVDGDAMDVDIDVVGDESSGDGSGPGHRPFFDRRRLHRISKDEAQPLHAATSPRSEPQLLPQSLTVPEPLHSPAPEHDSLPLSPQTQHPPSESGSELMLSEPEPQQPTREASPPPPPKVKMSLKDFALRKKKQREEEMAAKALTSPGSPDDHGLPPSPNVDGKRDLAVDNAGGAEENEEKVGFPGVVNDVDVQMKDATVTHARDVSFPSVNGNGVNVELNGRHDDDPSVSQRPPKPVQDQQASLVAKKTGVMVIAPPPEAAQPSPRFAPSLTPLPRASDESTVQTQINGRTGAAPVTLKAKVEMMDSVIPSGLVAADGDCAADAVSFAPEPPPPPLTTKQTSDANVAEGRRTTAPASTPTPSISSRSTSTGITVSAPSHPDHVPHAHIPTNIPLSRKPSHEDGEITSSTPPKTYLPRSYTPPTQPRSFHATHPPSPNLGPTSSSSSSSSAPASRRPAPPPLSRSPLSNAAGPAPVPISSRPLPSGPRALRGSMSQTTQPPPYTSTRPPYVGSQYIPRGPSADRDRLDWDRDRQWAASSRSRGRAGSNGWGR